MSCRVLLFVIALTCTFQREITADTDDVLCVVILSGLQKEDLDKNILAKLQRHNVNIDDINDRKNIERCILRSSSDKLKTKGSAKKNVPSKNVQSKQTRVNNNVNETKTVQDLYKANQNINNFITSKIENNTHVESSTIPGNEKFIELWKTSFNTTTSHQGNEVNSTEKNENNMILKLPLSSENKIKIDFRTTNFNSISEILKSISATKAATMTINPTTDNYQLQKQVDNMSQQVTEFLKKNNINHNKSYIYHESGETKSKQTSTSEIKNIVNETVRVEETSKDNEKQATFNPLEIENGIATTVQNSSFEDFIHFWIKLNNTSHQDYLDKITKKTEKYTTVPDIFAEETKSDSKVKDVDLIHEILGSYLFQQAFTTTKSTTTELEQTSTSKINYILDKTVRVDKTSKDNEERAIINLTETENGIGTILQKPSLSNLWVKLSKTNQDIRDSKDSKAKDIDLIYNMLDGYLSQQAMTTTKATTTESEQTSTSKVKAKDIDLIYKMLESYLSQQAVTTTKATTTESEQTSTSINYIVGKTVSVEETSKDNEDRSMINPPQTKNAKGTIIQKPSFENYMGIWIKLNETNHQDVKGIMTKKPEKSTTVSDIFVEKTKSDSKAKDIDLIHKMLKSYISQQVVTTTKSTTTESEPTSTSKINYIVGKTVRVEETTQDNEDQANLNPSEIENGMGILLQNPSFENFFNLWLNLNKTNHQDNKDKITKRIEQSITLPSIFQEESISDFKAKDTDFIHKMLESYLSQQTVTTTKFTTAEKPFDSLSQQIKGFIENSNIHHDTGLTDRTLDETFKNRNDDERSLMSNFDFNIPVPLIHIIEDVPKLEKKIRMPIDLIEDPNPQSKYIDMLKDYFSAKHAHTSTQIPTEMTPQDIDMILQTINEFFEKQYTNNYKVPEKYKIIKDTTIGIPQYLGNRDLNAFITHPNNDQDWFTRRSVSIESNNEMRNQYQSTIPSPYNTNSKYDKLHNLQFVEVKDDIKSLETPIIFNNNTKDSRSKELHHIFRMLETYIARKDTETATPVPTTTPKRIVIPKKLTEYLKSNNNKHRKKLSTTLAAQNQFTKVTNVDKTKSKLLVNSKDKLQKQANKSDSKMTQKHLQQNINSKLVKNEVLKKHKLNDDKGNKEAKILPEHVIRELTEKIKQSVLNDLQKQMLTTLQTVTKATTKKSINKTTIVKNIPSKTTASVQCEKLVHPFQNKSSVKSTTEIPSTTNALRIDHSKIKNASKALENFIELLEQFKHVQNYASTPRDLQHALTPEKSKKKKGKTKNELHVPITVVSQTLLPRNYSHKVTNTAFSPIFGKPYAIKTNNPMVHKTRTTNKVQVHYGVDPWKNMKSNMNRAMHAAVIQTDDAQVPLLGIPVPESISPLNQNIIVTTKHPMIQFRQNHEHASATNLQKRKHQDYSKRGYGKYDTHSDRQPKPNIVIGKQYDPDMTRYYSDMERAYGRGSYLIPHYKKRIQRDRLPPRSRQANLAADHFYQEFLSNIRPTSDIPWDQGGFMQERKRERFLKKVERPDDRPIRHRNRVTPKKDNRIGVAPRLQFSMNNFKKINEHEDLLYRNFRKSQQRVNDMLENMLKPTNRVRSVEAI